MSLDMDARLARVVARLKDTPSIALPTDYPRPSTHRLVEAIQSQELDEKTAVALLKLTLFQEEHEEEPLQNVSRPTPFHLLLSAFSVLLHRYTGDSDLVFGSSSALALEPLLLRIKIEPTDSFWSVVRRVQTVQSESEADAVPYENVVRALGADQDGSAPLFRVRFFDETDGHHENFLRSTSLTSDLTVFVTRSHSSTHSSLVPRIILRVAFNSLLFTPDRISTVLDQLSVLLRTTSLNPGRSIGSVPLLTPAQKSILPNPTQDLRWCDWKGAITDVFSRNARSHPDKTCVVQSLASDRLETQARVRYTYRQILNASNILSHYLIRGGVQREDVVMVYAYRSVEMVVAVMAILKAGATFSVIGTNAFNFFNLLRLRLRIVPDPAYPAYRQNIYLRVTKPRALVVLRGAGSISQVVREFISAELKIKVEVPALEFSPNHDILGGPLAGQEVDVLGASRHLGDVDPSVALGPDSIGTLSFTSGSTGIPKGVRGRHYSLTHFFPWMGERFGLGPDSKFTMLSGIAHDPIQRDSQSRIYTPPQCPTADPIVDSVHPAFLWCGATRTDC